MKIKLVLFISLSLVMCSVMMAQKPKAAVVSPEMVVKNLYTAHKLKKSPFFQNKSRALVDKYFTGALADAIWKEAIESTPGEVGNLDFDPLFYAQDIKITKFLVGKADENNVVKVTFLNMGNPEEINFFLTRPNTSSKVYKIDSIVYSDAEDLEAILSYELPTDGQPEAVDPMDGNYLIGDVKCGVETTKGGYWARIKCDDQPNVQIVDTETMTFGTFNKKEKGRRGHFVVGDDRSIKKFIDASGKEISVSRVN